MDAETRGLLALNRITMADPGQIQSLLAHFGSATAALESLDEESACAIGLSEAVVNRLKKNALRDIDRQLDKDASWLDKEGHFVLTRNDPDYPRLLREIADPPFVLYCHGRREALDLPGFAIVGSRSPTRGGHRCARQFASQLAAGGIAVTSGMAIGIDSAAHRGALEAGGTTIAVLGTGCDRIYPGRHRHLAGEIRAAGLLVSEFPLGAKAFPSHFPQRNRVVTGLCYGTLVVEATLRSGSLISARLAMEQGREVFAVPGSIHDRQSHGCHYLIKHGARLTESIDDIVEELADRVRFSARAETPDVVDAVPAEQARILDVMSREALSVDALIEATGLAPQQVSSALIELEINEFVERRPGGFILGPRPANTP